MDVQIRKASPNDWSTIQRLNDEVFQDNAKYDDAINPTWALSEEGATYFKEATSLDSYMCLVAEVDQQAVGYIIASEKFLDFRTVKTLELNNMGVSPSFRSRGVGKALVDALKKEAKKRGFDRLYVTSYFKNDRAIAFYKRLDFEPIDLSLEAQL